MSETVYCDNYDEISGSVVASTVEAKVVTVAEEKPAPKHSAKAETKDK